MEKYIDNIKIEVDIIAEKLENIKNTLTEKNDKEVSISILIVIFLNVLKFERDLNIIDKFKKRS